MVKFTDMLLKSLKPKVRKYQIRETTGFAIRVAPTGSKTFLFIYESAGKRKEINLGSYPAVSISEARNKYNEASISRARGEDPKKLVEPVKVEKVRLASDLVKEYTAWCYDNHVLKWALEKDRVFTQHVLPILGNLPVADIKRRHVLDMMTALREGGVKRGGLRNTFRAISSMFTYAETMQYTEISPCRALRKVLTYVKSVDRSRVLSESEIPVLWKMLDEYGAYDTTKNAMKLILVTAQRPGEVTNMEWEDIDGDWWIIPPNKAQKGKRHHRVYLTDTAKALMGDPKSGFVFRSSKFPEKAISLSSVQTIARNLQWGTRWTPHDLRRTARTHMARLGIPREHGEAVLNHAKAGMVKVYDQYEYDAEKKAALLLWEKELKNLTQPCES